MSTDQHGVPENCLDPACGRPMAPQQPTAQQPIAVLPPGHVRHQGRGLCARCHRRHRHAGTLLDFPRIIRSYDDTLEEWDVLRAQEKRTRVEAAARLGMSVTALDKAIEWGLANGDPRAVWAPKSRTVQALQAARKAVEDRRRGWPRVLA